MRTFEQDEDCRKCFPQCWFICIGPVALGCFIAGCVIVPTRLDHLAQIESLDADKDFREISPCYILQVWNRPTDRIEICGGNTPGMNDRGRCWGIGEDKSQDVCHDDFVFLFAFDGAGLNRTFSPTGPILPASRDASVYPNGTFSDGYGSTGYPSLTGADIISRTQIRELSNDCNSEE